MIQFYYGSGSPFAWRVQLVLEEKHLEYEPVLLSFSAGDHKSPEHLERHPHGKVPTLSDGEVALYESSAIVEYLEDAYPEPALMPASAAERARVRLEQLECTEYLVPAFRTLGRLAFFTPPDQRDEQAVTEARSAVATEVARLESRMAPEREFLVGDALTLADLCWLPFVEICERAGVPVSAADLPRITAWRDRLRERPSYERSYPPHWKK